MKAEEEVEWSVWKVEWSVRKVEVEGRELRRSWMIERDKFKKK